MNIERQIQTLRMELYGRGTIPCALLGRKVRDTECCSRSLAATVEEFQRCRACPRGHGLAAKSPLPQRDVLPVAPWPVFAGAPVPRPLLLPTRPASSKAEPAAPRRWIWFDETMPWPPRPTSQAKPVARSKAPHPERQARLIPAPRPEAPASTVAAPRPKRKYTRRAVQAPAAEQLAQALVAPPAPPAPEPQLVDPRLVRLASVLRELTRDGRMRVSMLDLMRALGAAHYDEAASLVLAAGLRTSQLSGPVQTVLVDHNARRLMESAAATEVRQ